MKFGLGLNRFWVDDALLDELLCFLSCFFDRLLQLSESTFYVAFVLKPSNV